jgi:hypothetical protein
MRKRMLRSVLVATFSVVVAFGTLNGLSDAKGDVRADSRWSVPGVAAGPAGEDAQASPADSIWS